MLKGKFLNKFLFVFVFFLLIFVGSIDVLSAASVECGSFSSGLQCSSSTTYIGSGYTQSACLSACESNNAGCCQWVSSGSVCLYSSSSGTTSGSDYATNCVECTSSKECDTYAGMFCDGSNWQSGSGTSYVCSTTNHCYSGTYYSNYYCNGAGSCSNHGDPIEPDSSTTACSCAGGTTLQNANDVGSNYYCCGDDGSSDDFYSYSMVWSEPEGLACSSCSNGAVTDQSEFYFGNGAHPGDSLTSDTVVECYYGDPSCSYSGGSDGSSWTLYGNGYLNDGTDRCFYGDMSCGDGTYSHGSSETCEDSCVGDDDGGSCSNTHNPGYEDVCYYNDRCSSSGCYYLSSVNVRENYCDTCSSSGVSSGQYCPDSGTSSGSTCYYGTQSCSGTSCTMSTDTTYANCIDAGDSSGSTCYKSSQSDDCTTSGWGCSGTPAEDNTYASCFGDGDISGSYCYYGSQSDYCTTSGWACNNGAYDSTKSTSCLENGDVSGGVCYYGSASDSCVAGVGWDCSSGDSDSTLYSSYDDSYCTYSNLDGSNDYCYYDGGDDCYYNSGTSCVDGSGWSFSYQYCEDPGYVSGSRCYYDSNGGGESNSCSSSGCVGIDYETTSVTCDVGSLGGGSMACWDGSTCYYSSDGCDYYSGWDFSSTGTACSAGTSTCCTSSSTIYEGVGCSSSGSTGSSYDRDSSQTRCESTASGCTSYSWDSAQGACCGDDGTSDDWISTAGVCDNGVWIEGGECVGGADCASGDYCRDSDHLCQDLPTCAEANSGTGYNVQESNEDYWNDCSASFDSCSNQYTKTGPDGFCSGSSYSCKTSGASQVVATGKVCQSGNEINPNGNSNCGTGTQNCYCDITIDCADGTCSAPTYYRGFSSSSCTSTNRQSRSTWNAADGTSISETTYKVGTSCNTDTSICSGTDNCNLGTYYTGYTCNGVGSCSSNTNVASLDEDLNSASCICYGGTWTNGPISSPSSLQHFLVKTSGGTSCFKIEESGNFEVTGSASYGQSILSAPTNSFSLEGGDGSPVFYIDSSCNLVSEGSLYTEQGSISYAQDQSFYLQRQSDSDYFFKITNTGDIYTLGKEGPYCEL